MESKKQDKVKQANAKVLDFTNQIIFVGIDVHKKNWKVTIYLQGWNYRHFQWTQTRQICPPHDFGKRFII